MQKNEKSQRDESEKIKFRDIKTFNFSFWMICLNIVVVYIDLVCFNNIISIFFQERFKYSITTTDLIVSIMDLIGAILCPIFGRIVDKYGQRASLILFSATCVTTVHIMFLLTPDSNKPIYPIFYMALLAIGYSIYASVI